MKFCNIDPSFVNDLLQHKSQRELINEVTVDFPTADDFNGAVKGMVMLQETYEMLLDATVEGKVTYYTSQNLLKEFQGREQLMVDDLYLMSQKATSQLLFDVAIEFLRAALNLAKTVKVPNSIMIKIGTLKKNLVHMNNQHLLRWQQMVGTNYKVLPYLVDENLNYKPDQPEELMENVHSIHINNEFQTDFCFKQVCKAGAFTRVPDQRDFTRCGYLHHFDPYLRLGPFKVEVIMRSPYISILHDLLTEQEIQWMIEYSVPRLSRVRENTKIPIQPKYEKHDKKKRQTVHKTVQCWIQDIKYDLYDDFTDPFNYTINYPLMFKLSKKLELATRMNITGKYSATDYQTTNYGLGGLCERHMDPLGYIEGAEVKGPHASLIQSGDMLGTIMAWLGDVEGGGATAFFSRFVEKAVMPSRGSAAFWYNLDQKGHRDLRSCHGGCPVIKGTKWIYYFNQFRNFPCALQPASVFPPPTGYYRNM
jgi:hypothetical protein